SIRRQRPAQYLPGHVRPERALFPEWAVPQPEQRHEVHVRPLVERHRRTADWRELLRIGWIRWKPDEQHLGIDAAEQRPADHDKRSGPEHRQHDRPSSTYACRSRERTVLRSAGPLRHRRPPALQRTPAFLSSEFSNWPGLHHELHVVALLRVSRRLW